MAENYIEILLLSKDNVLTPDWINVTIPSKESIEFLDGLLGLIGKVKKSEIIGRWVNKGEDGEGSLFSSFKDGDGQQIAREFLRKIVIMS